MRFDNNTAPGQLARLWQNLPVFRLAGGDGLLRQSFLDLFARGCEQRDLVTFWVKGAITSTELTTMATRADVVLVDEVVDVLFPLSFTIRLCPDGHVCRLEGDVLLVGATVMENTLDDRFWSLVTQKLQGLFLQVPVWACILIGGKSTRMGYPKHLLTDGGGVTWLERAVRMISPLVSGLAVSGAGDLPASLVGLPRLTDIPGVVGPLNGIISASRWQPLVSWLVVACDMPCLTEDAVRWLLADRRAGCWGRIPHLAGNPFEEPLFSWYDMRAAHLFEEQLFTGNMKMNAVANHPKLTSPEIPQELSGAWKNFNTPEQLKKMAS